MENTQQHILFNVMATSRSAKMLGLGPSLAPTAKSFGAMLQSQVAPEKFCYVNF